MAMRTISHDTPLLIPNGIATVEVFFYLPDRPTLIAPPFVWQTADFYPIFPRVKTFVEHWWKNIDALIQEVLVTHDLSRGKRNILVVENPLILQ